MKIKIYPYDPNWTNKFEEESKILKELISDENIRVEHIGSTSVRDLDAKPIIDMMIGLENFQDSYKYIESLEENGYIYHPELESQLPNRRFFSKTQNAIKTHHIHMVQIDLEFWNRHLFFRDHLRINAENKRRYQELKYGLAKKEWKDENEYANAKNDFIRNIEKQRDT